MTPQSEVTPEIVEEIFRIFQQRDPSPRSELDYENLYTLLVAVVLSAQATDKSVNQATKILFSKASTPEAMVALGLENIREIIKTVGLYNTKAQNVFKLSQQLLQNHGGQVPSQRDALENLPGVGRKTANVVLNLGFGKPTIAIDTHIFRVSHRLGLSQASTPLGVEKDLEALIPPHYKKQAHYWLVLHGRYICKARKPQCSQCPLVALCPYPSLATSALASW